MNRLLPLKSKAGNLAAALLLFLTGAYFDILRYRLPQGSALLDSGLAVLCIRAFGGVVFALIILMVWRAARGLKGIGVVGWRPMLALFLLLNAVTALYCGTMKTVYFWDNAGYWTVARTLAQAHLGRSQLFQVLTSTISMDYNYLLAFPISLVMRVFGGSRAVFLFSIANLYILPGLWGLCAMAKGRDPWGGLVLAGCFPMFVYIGLTGFVDVAACTLAIWALVIYTGDAPAADRGIFVGFLLVCTFLLRRYFFFFAASFGVAALAVKLLFRHRSWRDFLALFGFCALCAAYMTPNFLLEKVLGTNYGDLYAAYDMGLGYDGRLFFRYFGLLPVLALLLGMILRFVKKDVREASVFALIQFAACFVAFVSVQTHGQQHLLLYVPALACLSCQLLPERGGGYRRRAAGAAAALLFGFCFIPKAQPASIAEIRPFSPLPSFTFYGPKRSDIAELRALADFVDGLSEETEKTAVVLSSSLTFNSETLTNLRPSLNLRAPARSTAILVQGSVDKRDAFNWNILTADYLIVADPVQTHLGEENQQVFALFAHDVLEGTGPGAAYSPLPETFTLEGGVTVRLYARTRPVTQAECQLISDRLTALYPAYAQQYAMP